MKMYPVLNHTASHQDVGGSGGIASCILKLSTRWRWVVISMPQLL